MTKFRNAVLFAALAALASLPFYGASFAQQQPAAKVSYAPVPGGEYKIDAAHSTIGFAVRHLEINWVEGRFKEFAGTIRYDDKDVTKSSVEFTAKIDSVDTGVEGRDKHLRNADFFDAPKYPEMTFKSTRVERRGRDAYVLHGDLTLKGVTKPVSFPFQMTGAIKDPWGNTRFGVSAEAKINRRDFGVDYDRALAAGGLVVGNDVTVSLQLEAVLPAPKPPAGQ
jgi:polyisoprenoid-binding protein YceI